jgi:pimeloyl-ACP methyl ester carboxylesterase
MRIMSAVSCALLCCTVTLAAQQPAEVRIRASDGTTVVGDLYRAAVTADSPAILLFHQGGGDARGEYADIIPRLLENGFHVLSTDVRGGGSRFGEGHRAPPLDTRAGYCGAYPDIDAAVSMARANGLHGPLILWGSSYTATLVVQAAARRSADVRAVLAFSPAGGELLDGCHASEYAPWLVQAGIPLFITRSSEELANEDARSRFDQLIEQGAQAFVAEGGGHGSSLLVDSRFHGDVTPLWTAVLEFLHAARHTGEDARHGLGYHAARGRLTVNVVPAEADDETSMRPPCAVTIRSAM